MDRAKLAEIIQVPEQSPGPLPMDLNPKALQVWRDTLPLANLKETSRRVYTLLREINRLEASEKQRLQFMQTLHPSFDYISNGLSKACQGHAHPLPEKVVRLVQVNQEFLAEVAIGYKILVLEALSRRLLFGSRERQMAEAMQAVLHYLGRIILESYRTYVPFPEGIWGEVHALYQLAEKRKLGQVKAEAFAEDGRLSLDDCYKRMLLLALASPYHLERGTIDAIHQRLVDWVHACKLRRLEDAGDYEVQIVVRLDSNKPPFFEVIDCSAGQLDQAEYQHYRMVDATALDAILEHELEQLQYAEDKANKTDNKAGKGAKPLKPELLRMLRDCWSGPTTRAESRYSGEVEVEVAIGLNAAHYYLTHGHGASLEEIGPEPVAPEPEDDAGESELSLEISAAPPPGDGSPVTTTEAKRDRVAELLLPADAAASWTQLRSVAPPASYRCRTLDFSANGCQLLCPRDSRLTLNVGDLISVGFEQSASGHWKLGVVRWIRQRNDGDTQLGVLILANQGRGVLAGVCDEHGYFADLSPCVELPGKAGPTLLTPRMPFASGKMVVIDDEQQEHFVRLGDNLESGSRFARFYYAALNERERKKIEAQRDRPVAKLTEKQLKAAMEGRGADELFDGDHAAWDSMPRDW
ncbi:MAG TPA: PilZ domain-containing protein [Gammaproteobacteria bacterium]